MHINSHTHMLKFVCYMFVYMYFYPVPVKWCSSLRKVTILLIFKAKHSFLWSLEIGSDFCVQKYTECSYTKVYEICQ